MKICGDKILSYKIFVLLILWQDKPLGAIQKVGSLKGGEESYKTEQKRTGEGGSSISERSLFKKIFKKTWTYTHAGTTLFSSFLLIIMAVWNMTQLLLFITFRSFHCTAHYLHCAFSAKMATYSLIIHMCTLWSVVKCTDVGNLVWRL